VLLCPYTSFPHLLASYPEPHGLPVAFFIVSTLPHSLTWMTAINLTSSVSPKPLLNCTPPDYSFHSTPRSDPSKTTSSGGTGFLVHEPFFQLPIICLFWVICHHYNFRIKRHLFTTSTVLGLHPPSPNRTQCFFSVSFVSIAETTPHEFITGDINIIIIINKFVQRHKVVTSEDNPTDHFTFQFHFLLSSFNLAQHKMW